MGQIWLQIEKPFFLDIWDVPWQISMATARRGTYMLLCMQSLPRVQISLLLARWEIGVSKRAPSSGPVSQLRDFCAAILLSSGSMAFPVMGRALEARRVRLPLLSSPGSRLLRRFRSQSLMKSVSIDTSCTGESYSHEFGYCGSSGALR